MKKISVLVPIYNVEKYLQQCLESLVNQTLAEIEIICINDGSTDDSLDIIKDFAKKDERIVIIDKENSGYGDSMNQGLAKAKGKYIAIVESDDFIELDAMERLYGLAESYDAEVVRANYFFNKNGKDALNAYVRPEDTGRVIDPKRNIWIFYEAPAIWSAIYRRDFLSKHKIKFLPTPGASYQDTGFNFKVWVSAHRAVFTNDAFLHYRLDNESSSVNNPGKVMNVVYEYAEIERYLRENDVFDDYAQVFIVAKFGAYFWNMCRLKSDLLKDFVHKVKTEYDQYNNEGIIDLNNFGGAPQRNLLKYILDHSEQQILLHIRRIRRNQKLRERARKVRENTRQAWIKLHPVYRKQLEIASLVAEVQNNNVTLLKRLEELEEKREAK